MKIRTVLDGNAFYEIDEECLEREMYRQREDRRNEDKTPGDERENNSHINGKVDGSNSGNNNRINNSINNRSSYHR